MAQDRLLAETAIRAFTQVAMLPGFGLKAQPGSMSAKGLCRDLRDNSTKNISDSLSKASLVSELTFRGLKGLAQGNKPQVLEALRRTDAEGATADDWIEGLDFDDNALGDIGQWTPGALLNFIREHPVVNGMLDAAISARDGGAQGIRALRLIVKMCDFVIVPPANQEAPGAAPGADAGAAQAPAAGPGAIPAAPHAAAPAGGPAQAAAKPAAGHASPAGDTGLSDQNVDRLSSILMSQVNEQQRAMEERLRTAHSQETAVLQAKITSSEAAAASNAEAMDAVNDAQLIGAPPELRQFYRSRQQCAKEIGIMEKSLLGMADSAAGAAELKAMIQDKRQEMVV
eukprot:COSAG01_NODE_3901_length_5561_cov_69.812340_2_plen_342_part_00